MANKIMKTLTVGNNTYEIFDEKARNDIEAFGGSVEVKSHSAVTFGSNNWVRIAKCVGNGSGIFTVSMDEGNDNSGSYTFVATASNCKGIGEYSGNLIVLTYQTGSGSHYIKDVRLVIPQGSNLSNTEESYIEINLDCSNATLSVGISNNKNWEFLETLEQTSATVPSGYWTSAGQSFAASNHYHSASNINSGTLSTSRLPTSGVTAGTYDSVTVDKYGRVTAGTALSNTSPSKKSYGSVNADGWVRIAKCVGSGSGIFTVSMDKGNDNNGSLTFLVTTSNWKGIACYSGQVIILGRQDGDGSYSLSDARLVTVRGGGIDDYEESYVEVLLDCYGVTLDVEISNNRNWTLLDSPEDKGDSIQSGYEARNSKSVTLSDHTHSASDIMSGMLSITRGGTGATTAEAARNNLGAAAVINSMLNIEIPTNETFDGKQVYTYIWMVGTVPYENGVGYSEYTVPITFFRLRGFNAWAEKSLTSTSTYVPRYSIPYYKTNTSGGTTGYVFAGIYGVSNETPKIRVAYKSTPDNDERLFCQIWYTKS